jgi:hypothetical protein
MGLLLPEYTRIKYTTTHVCSKLILKTKHCTCLMQRILYVLLVSDAAICSPPWKSSAPRPFLIDFWACNQCRACKEDGFVRETRIYRYYRGRFPLGADAFKTAVTGSSEKQRPGDRDRVPVCPSMSIHPIQCLNMSNLHTNLENEGRKLSRTRRRQRNPMKRPERQASK